MKNKTNPKSIRFNKEHLECAFNKLGINNEQKLIDILLEEIFNKYNKQETLTETVLNKIRNTILDFTSPQPQSNYTINTKSKEQILERIKQLEQEIKNPPKNTLVGVKAWMSVRENELKELKNYELDRKSVV